MKNIEVVDGALNSRFEIYAIEDAVFERLFGRADEIYIEDLSLDLQEDADFWGQVYSRAVERHSVKGIHGILHTHPKAKISILEESVIS